MYIAPRSGALSLPGANKNMKAFLLSALSLILGNTTGPECPPGLLGSLADFESWLQSESVIAFNKLVDNIGGYGTNGDAVINGMPIASPSRLDPDYYYIWTRDAAITLAAVVDKYFKGGAHNTTLHAILMDYIRSSERLQRVTNPSGDFTSLSGLGEPKFAVDGSPFQGNWGRPQRDGPGLRASTIMDFINTCVLLSETTHSSFADAYWSVIVPDLQYIQKFWQQPGFDLWEEIDGHHLYTSIAQMRALSQGAYLATELGDTISAASFAETADDIARFIRSTYWSFGQERLVETDTTKRSGLDSATILAAINMVTVPNRTLSDSVDLYPWSDDILQYLEELIRSMESLFDINTMRIQQFATAGKNTNLTGVGIGRYPEDVYDGYGISRGNPWFLCTTTVAQALYAATQYFASRTSSYTIRVTKKSEVFFDRFLGGFPGYSGQGYELSPGDKSYECLVSSMFHYADSFMDVVRTHMDQSTGQMSEQFYRDNGYMCGAADLTWSYGAFYTAAEQRASATKEINDFIGIQTC